MPAEGGPRRRPATGPTPQPDRATPPYGYPVSGRGRRQEPQEWPAEQQQGRQEWPDARYPDAGYQEAGYQEPGYQEAGYAEAGYEENWYPEEPQWDGGFPETDPNLRYREPGPGMPGYRGSREHRYGGDRY
jgi:hypothetical protein